MGTTTAAPAQLSAELNTFLQRPQLVLVTTIDADTGYPSASMITWALAFDDQTVRLAAEAHGRILHNLNRNPRLLLTIMTGGACFAIAGTARAIAAELAGPAIKLGCAEVAVESVTNVMFWGGKITVEPRYDVTYDHALKQEMDEAVFTAMRALPVTPY